MHGNARTLTGPWMGRFSYVTQVRPPVAFNATFQDDNGNLSGETLEPNSFSQVDIESLIAGIIGVREGSLVRWTKSYSDFDGQSIEYEGTVNANFTRIEGKWSFPAATWDHGTFVMIRDTVAVDKAVSRTKQAKATLAAHWGTEVDDKPPKK